MPDHFETLGVSRTADAAEIRKAYLRLIKDRHPDRFSDPAEKEEAQRVFKEVTEAFNTLSSPRARREYEAELARARETPEQLAADAYAGAARRIEQRDYPGAVELLRVAVHHVPQQAEYQAALARALARQPQTVREAVQAFEKLVQQAPGVVGYHLELATLLAEQGLRLRARRVVESALRLAPEDPGLRSLAADLGPDEGPHKEKGQSGPIAGLRGLLGRKS